MKLWATNEVRAKSKFWYFLRKLKKVKKSNGQVLAINEGLQLKGMTLDMNLMVCIFSTMVISCGCGKRQILPTCSSMPHGRNWAPFHAIVATPLVVDFELLLCVHLERRYVVNLKIVFLPLLALEIAILVDNIRMCRALMPGDEENISDETIWETILHLWVSISMVFFIAATTFTLLKLCENRKIGTWFILSFETVIIVLYPRKSGGFYRTCVGSSRKSGGFYRTGVWKFLIGVVDKLHHV